MSLNIVLDPLKTVESVTLGVWVQVGSRLETQLENGSSHFLEHMAFKGTTTKSALDIASSIEGVGADMNAYTSYETTAYHIRTLKEHVPLALDILQDILKNSTFDKGEFERERGVILQELGQTLDSPEDLVFDLFQETCFSNQSLGRSILGTKQTLNSFDHTCIKRYMDTRYSSKSMVFSASGNFDESALKKEVQKAFDGFNDFNPYPMEKSTFTSNECRLEKDLEQVHLLLGFEGVTYYDPRYYVQSLLSVILGGGMASRLFQEIREKRGLVYSVYSFAQSFLDNGVFGLYAGTGEHETKELFPTLCEELKKVPHTLTDEEVRRAKNQLKASLLMALESTSSRCRQQAHQQLVFNRRFSTQEIIASIDGVCKKDIQDFAADLFSKRPALTCLGPLSSVPTLDHLNDMLR